MGEWSEYFEDFPDENPANQRDPKGAALQARVAREEKYSPEMRAAEQMRRAEYVKAIQAEVRLKRAQNSSNRA